MKPGRSFFVFENILTTPRRKLFRFLGVDIWATPYVWLSIPSFFSLGMISALIDAPGKPVNELFLLGASYGIIFYIILPIHSLGHLLTGKIVGAPLDAVLLTATRHVILHLTDQLKYSPARQTFRTLGGPLFNFLLWLISFGLYQRFPNDWLLIFGYSNLAIGAFALCPIPSLDGWVIWKKMFASLQ